MKNRLKEMSGINRNNNNKMIPDESDVRNNKNGSVNSKRSIVSSSCSTFRSAGRNTYITLLLQVGILLVISLQVKYFQFMLLKFEFLVFKFWNLELRFSLKQVFKINALIIAGL